MMERQAVPGYPWLVQLWCAGNHSDVGGILSETESRLSDIALAWMCEEATKVPDGLKTAPMPCPKHLPGRRWRPIAQSQNAQHIKLETNDAS